MSQVDNTCLNSWYLRSSCALFFLVGGREGDGVFIIKILLKVNQSFYTYINVRE